MKVGEVLAPDWRNSGAVAPRILCWQTRERVFLVGGSRYFESARCISSIDMCISLNCEKTYFSDEIINVSFGFLCLASTALEQQCSRPRCLKLGRKIQIPNTKLQKYKVESWRNQIPSGKPRMEEEGGRGYRWEAADALNPATAVRAVGGRPAQRHCSKFDQFFLNQ